MKIGSAPRTFSPIWPVLLLTLLCCASTGSPLWAQETPSEPPTPTPTPAPTPIPAAEVPAQTGVTKTELDRISARAGARESVAAS